jgi:hypothetical protein
MGPAPGPVYSRARWGPVHQGGRVMNPMGSSAQRRTISGAIRNCGMDTEKGR